jgi:hypothetical protein
MKAYDLAWVEVEIAPELIESKTKQPRVKMVDGEYIPMYLLRMTSGGMYRVDCDAYHRAILPTRGAS